MTAVPFRCEWRDVNEDTECGRPVKYVVAIGTRKTDEQLSCRPHLARTIDAMIGAEGRDARATVRMII